MSLRRLTDLLPPLAFGLAVLAIWDGRTALYCGLILISLGAGGIKPSVSAHVGDQFTEKNKHLLAKIFDVFYFSVNFGSFFSTILIPWVLPRYGASWAFGIPGILMALATLVFWIGRKQYVQFLDKGVVGVDAKTGQFLWRYAKTSTGPANIPTPVVRNGYVYSANARRFGAGLAAF